MDEVQELLDSSTVLVIIEEILLGEVSNECVGVLLFIADQNEVFGLDDKVIGRI